MNLYEKIRKKVLFRKSNEYYSHLGEDVLVNHLFRNQNIGSFVDVGANDPVVYSTTYKLYCKGWSGVCIEPNQVFRQDFEKLRPRDKFENCAISEREGDRNFRVYQDSRLSHITDDLVEKTGSRLITIPSLPLCRILEKNQVAKNFELLNIDVEGFELEVLQTLDFSIYTPKCILVEIHHLDFEQLGSCDIYQFLKKLGYRLIAHSLVTSIFVHKSFEGLN